MSLLGSITSALFGGDGQRSSPPAYFGAQSTYLAGPLYLDAYGAKRSPAGYELVEQYKSIIYSCVQMNALGVSRVPLRLYNDASKGGRAKEVAGPRSVHRSQVCRLKRSGYLQRTTADDQDIEEITVHPLLDCLDHPDSEGYFSRSDLLSLIVAYCDVVGVAYLKMDPPAGRRPPSYLWIMQSQYVFDIKVPGTPLIDYYQYYGERYLPDDVLRFRITMGLRDPYGRGYSPTYAALQYAMLEDKYVSVQDQLLGQGPRPSLLVSAKDATMPFGESQRRRLEQDIERQHARGNAGRALVTDGSVDINPLTYSPTDLSGMQLSEYDLERVCNVFGIPVSYFTKDTNLANLQAAETQHAKTAIEPRCKAIAGIFTRLARRYDERLFFAFDDSSQEDKEQEARIIDMGLKSGRITINEANVDSPWEAKDWGDEPWMPGTLKQPEMLRQAHEQGMVAQKAGVDNESKLTEHQLKGEKDDGDPEEPGDSPGADRSSLLGRPGGALYDAVPSVDRGSLDGRLDAVIAAMERSLGL